MQIRFPLLLHIDFIWGKLWQSCGDKSHQAPNSPQCIQFIVTEAETSLSSGAGWGATQVNSAGGWRASSSGVGWAVGSLAATGPPCRIPLCLGTSLSPESCLQGFKDVNQIFLAADLLIHSRWVRQLRDTVKKVLCGPSAVLFPPGAGE